MPKAFAVGFDNDLAFARRDTALVRSDRLKQEVFTPHSPQQKGVVERVIRSLKRQGVHRQRFDSIQQATRAIGDWIRVSNNRPPPQALASRTPAEAFPLADDAKQRPIGRYRSS